MKLAGDDKDSFSHAMQWLSGDYYSMKSTHVKNQSEQIRLVNHLPHRDRAQW
ncbi:MAG TPA: hypothetical protein VN281_04910 [Verrucomicrobiae bacterium]|nr:hypothetical protein [Verrucomicrobiae bacterium]